MKPKSPLAIYFLSVLIILLFIGCNHDKPKEGTDSKEPGITESPAAIPGHEETSIDGNKNENPSLPVYATWVSKMNMNQPFDGMYDSTSGYISLCETMEERHVDDPSEISLSPANKCYRQGSVQAMMSIRSDSGLPVFLTIIDVDTINKKVIGLTNTNDTIVSSVITMKQTEFETLKQDYKLMHVKLDEIKKIQHYNNPDMIHKSQEKKKELMRRKQF